MNLLLAEDLVPLHELLASHPATKAVLPRTARHWATSGIKTAAGPVRLETLRVGARVMSSRPALDRFLAALNPGTTADTTPAPRSPSDRNRASERAAEALAAAGA